jgi:hypothetical protein
VKPLQKRFVGEGYMQRQAPSVFTQRHTNRRFALHPLLSVRHLGDYQTIGIAFEKLMVWAAGKNLLATPMRTFALHNDDPISKPKQNRVSDACL